MHRHERQRDAFQILLRPCAQQKVCGKLTKWLLIAMALEVIRSAILAIRSARNACRAGGPFKTWRNARA